MTYYRSMMPVWTLLAEVCPLYLVDMWKIKAIIIKVNKK